MKKLNVGQRADNKLGKLHNPEVSLESVVWANFFESIIFKLIWKNTKYMNSIEISPHELKKKIILE